MEKKIIVTRQELDKLFLDLMAYTELGMVAAMLDLRLSNPISDEEVLADLTGMFNGQTFQDA